MDKVTETFERRRKALLASMSARSRKIKHEQAEVLVPNLDGTAIRERVKVTIPLQWDEEIKEWLLTPEAHQIIEDTQARRMGLLLPEQFQELRERCGYTQKEMGELFQVGEKSWTRWESGKHRPSRSISLLVRALYDGEMSINYLLKRAGKTPREETENALDLRDQPPSSKPRPRRPPPRKK